MKILLGTLADGTPFERTGQYVVEYDPKKLLPDGRYDGGLLTTTYDITKAREFHSHDELFEYWRQTHGLREDGEPNRPLTAYCVSVIP